MVECPERLRKLCQLPFVMLPQNLNVSIYTVSRALDGYDDVADKTRQLVIESASEMGYAGRKQKPWASLFLRSQNGFTNPSLPSLYPAWRMSYQRRTLTCWSPTQQQTRENTNFIIARQTAVRWMVYPESDTQA